MASLTNIGLTDVNINGNNYVAGLVARIQEFTQVERCFVTGNVTGFNIVGGVVAYMEGADPVSHIVDCYSTSEILTNSTDETHYAGGIVAYRYRGTVERNYATGPLYTIVESSNVGAVIGRSAGGAGNISGNYWNIETTELETGGPGVGPGLTTFEFLLRDTFVGFDFEDVWNIDEENSYAYLQWEGEQANEHNYPPLLPPANLSASGCDEIVNLQWDAPDENIGVPEGYHVYREGNRINEELIEVLEYQDTGLTNWTTYEYTVTAVYDNEESMHSLCVTATTSAFAGGSGSEDDPYLVETALQLNGVRLFLDRHFRQIEDINLGEPPWNVDEGWEPLGCSPDNSFHGSYDGGGYTITGLYIERSDASYQGLFGYTAEAVISNAGLVDVEIEGHDKVGSLAGMNKGSTIKNCFSQGSVSGNNSVGGLLGHNESGVNVKNSYYSGDIEGNNEVGGLVGNNESGSIIFNCYSMGSVAGSNRVGGLVGYSYLNTSIENCYSTCDVSGDDNIGGLAGRLLGSTISYSYSVGGVEGAISVGGLVGDAWNATTVNSYWNTQTSGQANSAGGEGRTTDQMTYPHSANTYVDWDFDDIWQEDRTGRVNQGYPFLFYYQASPYPDIASDPQPSHQAVDVSIGLEALEWVYHESPAFTNPVGFRVYMNTTGEFEEDDPFTWEPYIEGETEYSSSDVLPDELQYGTTYYWKIVPTTIEPGRSGGEYDSPSGRQRIGSHARETAPLYRGDARECPVWSFTTELIPYPVKAVNPYPVDETTGVCVFLESLKWEYIVDETHTNPLGFRVYMNTTGEFDEDDPFEWEPFIENETEYSNSDILPDNLQYETTYYWKVIPTTIDPGRYIGGCELPSERLRVSSGARKDGSVYRGDAQDCPIWSFTTREPYPYPDTAANPNPADEETNVPVDINNLSWEYEVNPAYTNPVGFRVYLNTTGEFDEDDDFEWVDYVEEQVEYSCSDILPDKLEYGITYYWQVIPTTMTPGHKSLPGDYITRSTQHSQLSTRNSLLTTHYSQLTTHNLLNRGDAQDCPVWSFTTEIDTHVSDEETPLQITQLQNYPNPFNPSTTISFNITKPATVSLNIFNVAGQKVKSLLEDQFLQSGNHSYVWSAQGLNNRQISSGIYYYRLKSRDNTGQVSIQTEKMIYLK